MNIPSTNLSYIDSFSDVDPNAISLKYFKYKLANTADNGDNSLSSWRYMSDTIPK